MNIKKAAVHMIFSSDGEIRGFFVRDEASKENLVFKVTKASLEEIENLFNSDKKI